MKLFVLDPHTIYRRELAASLGQLDGVERVDQAASVSEARASAALADADLVILDPAGAGIDGFISSVGARVIVSSSDSSDQSVLSALRAGAIGYLRKDDLTPESLRAAVTALGPGRPTRLTDREQQVLALIADGHPTREVAEQLSYSERTVKNVLHNVVTKLNARSRSQAVAFAVREGLI